MTHRLVMPLLEQGDDSSPRYVSPLRTQVMTHRLVMSVTRVMTHRLVMSVHTTWVHHRTTHPGYTTVLHTLGTPTQRGDDSSERLQ